MGWVLLAVVLAVPLWFGIRLWRVARAYQRQFCAAHCVEVAESLMAIAKAACAQSDEPANVEGDDPRGVVTSQSLALFYEVTESDEDVVHQLKVALLKRYTPTVIGTTMMLYATRLLGQDQEFAHYGVSKKPVYYLTFVLSPEQHAEFLTRQWVIPNEEETRTIYRELLTASERLELESLKE